MERIKLNIDSIDAYNRFYGLPTSHPLAAVIDLKEARQWPNHFTVEYGVYALFLKNNVACSMRYGRRNYDYQAGTIVSFSPGHKVEVDMVEDEVKPDVVGLLFHPDLIYGTPLADKIKDFSFFDYTEMESLHLSDDERGKFLFCLDQVKQEIEHPVDNHSSTLISANIQLVVEYLHRFYDRQFITRHKVNSDVVARFERHLKEYMAIPRNELPGVAYFADKANLSPGYFSDLVRKETGSSPKDIITLRLVETAKHRLAAHDCDISEIAYALGFGYPAHFTRMFKRETGMSPREFRAKLSLN